MQIIRGVTHVLVNNPAKGYGIYTEKNMIWSPFTYKEALFREAKELESIYREKISVENPFRRFKWIRILIFSPIDTFFFCLQPFS